MEYALRERVIAIVGPLSTTVQSLMNGLTREGADVALLNPEAHLAERFCGQLTDQREISTKHGRAMAVKTDLKSSATIKESIGKVAQTFGGLDVFIDAQLHNAPTIMKLEDDAQLEADIDRLMQDNLRSSLLLTAAVAGYLKARKKGRILFLFNEACFRGQPEDAVLAAARAGLVQFASSFSKSLMEHNVTVNCLSLGYTEEFLLARDSGNLIKAALEKQKISDRFAKITEPDKITNAVTYLIGPSGAAVTGQCIHLS